jgi:hypothetical protein
VARVEDLGISKRTCQSERYPKPESRTLAVFELGT